jgi:hypothetical protein
VHVTTNFFAKANYLVEKRPGLVVDGTSKRRKFLQQDASLSAVKQSIAVRINEPCAYRISKVRPLDEPRQQHCWIEAVLKHLALCVLKHNVDTHKKLSSFVV